MEKSALNINNSIPKWVNPVNGIITSSFGERANPVLDKGEVHDGIDIAVAAGTQVKAVQDGVITEVASSPTYGNVLKYKTDSGYEIMYAHLEKALAEPGQIIKQGEAVALSGSTGLSTGAHLHYTIIKDGELLDPFLYINMPYTNEVKIEYEARGQSLPSQLSFTRKD